MRYKRIIMLACAVVLCTALSVVASAAVEVRVGTASYSTSMTEQTVDVPVSISGNTDGILGLALDFSCADGISLTSVKRGSALSSLDMTPGNLLTDDPYTILWDGLEADVTNGEIAVLTFTVPANAVYDYPVKVAVTNLYDNGMKDIDYTVADGSILLDKPSTDGISFLGASLILDGSIGMKLYFDIDTSVTDLEKTVLTYTAIGEGSTGTTTFKVGKDGRTATVTLYTPAKSLHTTYWETNLVHTDLNGNTTDLGSLAKALSIKSYITALKDLAKQGDEDAVAALDVVEAMDTYCLYAQNYFFDQHTLGDLTAEPGDIAPASKTGAIEGITHYETSLVLYTTTTIRHYFIVTDETVLDDLTVASNDGTVIFDGVLNTKNGVSYVKVDISNIPAHKLGTQYTLTLTSGGESLKIVYSATNYVEMTYNGGNSLAYLSKALYNYYTEAKAYERYLADKIAEEDEIHPDIW